MLRPVLAVCIGPLLTGGLVVAADPAPRLPVLANADAWGRLPGAPAADEPLPAWARALAGWQPVTTARMLELDAAHRAGDRLDGRFRAVVRWAAADANRCEYAMAMAAADFDRSAGHPSDLAGLMKQSDRLPEADRLGAAFARRMMREASQVTDAEVKRLIELLGDERMVALVALVAHASFQDRLLLALRVAPEPGGVPPPVKAKFARPKPRTPAHPPAAPMKEPTAEESPIPSETWLRGRRGMETQKQRPGRIAVPSTEFVNKRLGPTHPSLWQNGIIWSRVCYGHQPELTDAWFDTAAAFRQEAGMDGTFGNVIFWTVTDALDCFY